MPSSRFATLMPPCPSPSVDEKEEAQVRARFSELFASRLRFVGFCQKKQKTRIRVGLESRLPVVVAQALGR